MTWGEFKKRAEELGITDSDQVGIIDIDERGRVVFETIAIKLPPVPVFSVKESA